MTKKELEARIAELEAQVDAFTHLRLVSAGASRQGGFSIEVASDVTRILAAALLTHFKASGGVNYIECVVTPYEDGIGPLILSLRRKWGKEPHEVVTAQREAWQSFPGRSCGEAEWNAWLFRMTEVFGSVAPKVTCEPSL